MTLFGNYVNDTLQFLPTEEGRVRLNISDNSLAYDYFIKDHLGNVRMVLTEEQQTDAYPPASMETAQSATENLYYSNINNTRTAKPSGYPVDNYTNPNDYAAKVRGDGQKIGPAMILKVMAGDKFNVRVNSWYKTYGASPGTPVSPFNDLLSILTNSIGGITTTHGGPTTTELQNSGVLTPGVTNFLNSQSYNSSKPKAFINWIFLDEQFKYYAGSVEQVGNNEEFKTHLFNDVAVNKSGYLYIYVSNETPNIDVYFDNLQVTHIRGALLETNEYYGFGLKMAGISYNAAGTLQNKEKTFQGQRFDDDVGLNWVQFKWRNHDPQIGRFIEIDPLAEEYVYNSTYAFSENKVTNHVELEGLEATPAGYLQEGFAQLTQAAGAFWDKVTGLFSRNKTEVSTNPNSSGTSIVTSHERTTYVGGNMEEWVMGGRYSSSNTMPNVLPYIFTVKSESKTKVEVVNTQKAGNLEVENRVATDGSSATTKATVKNVKVGNLPPLDISGSVTKDQNGTTRKVDAKTGTNNLKVGATLEVSNDKNGNFKQGKAGVIFEVKKETKNGTTIKNTTTIGKTF